MLQELTFDGIALDAKRKCPMVNLKDRSKKRFLPIYIGQEQAKSILSATELRDRPARPMTHDLFSDLLETWSMDLKKIVINSMNENDVYLASLHVKQGNIIKEIDCRPSDAIALAVRANCPIFVSQALMETNSVAL